MACLMPSGIQNSQSARVLVSSDKRHGRFNFCVCLINHLVTRTSAITAEGRAIGVCVLDLDYHQPLLRPQQHVYAAIIRKPLFGPSLVQTVGKRTETSYQILRQHFVTQLAVQESPQFFAQIVSDLISCIREHALNLSLVVILPAHVTIGGELHASLQSLGLTDTVKIEKSGSSTIPTLSSSVRRALQIQSRLQFLGYDSENNAQWCPRPLMYQHERAITLSYGIINGRVSGICTMNGELLPGCGLDFVLLQSIVSLVAVEKEHFTSIVEPGDEVKLIRSAEGFPILSTTYTAKFPFQARYSNCLGLAYISGISVSKASFRMILEHGMDLGSTEEISIVAIVGSNDEWWIWDEEGL